MLTFPLPKQGLKSTLSKKLNSLKVSFRSVIYLSSLHNMKTEYYSVFSPQVKTVIANVISLLCHLGFFAIIENVLDLSLHFIIPVMRVALIGQKS